MHLIEIGPDDEDAVHFYKNQYFGFLNHRNFLIQIDFRNGIKNLYQMHVLGFLKKIFSTEYLKKSVKNIPPEHSIFRGGILSFMYN